MVTSRFCALELKSASSISDSKYTLKSGASSYVAGI